MRARGVATSTSGSESEAIFANITIINRIRQFDTAGGSSLWSTLGDGSPIGYRPAAEEASGMASSVTTGAYIAVAGDLKKYQIVDRLGTVLVLVPAVIDQAAGRPTAPRLARLPQSRRRPSGPRRVQGILKVK